MEALVRVAVDPHGVWTTPWQADSLLGSLACVWARTRGAGALRRDFLEPWLAGEPHFVLSDAFPGDAMPMPVAASLLWDWPRESRKSIKRMKWLPPAEFSAFQNGRRPDVVTSGQSRHLPSIQHHVRLRNTVARATAPDAAGSELFEVPYSTLTRPDVGLTIYARVSKDGLAILSESLEQLGRTGFGADASVGHGGFDINVDSMPNTSLDEVPNANGFVSLSTHQPSALDPVDGYWQTVVKYGTMAPEFHDAVVFKRPQVMLAPGACFRTPGHPEPFYGGAISPDDLLSERDRSVLAARGVDPVQAAFCLAVPMKWSAEGGE